jgi:hypothetical protein
MNDNQDMNPIGPIALLVVDREIVPMALGFNTPGGHDHRGAAAVVGAENATELTVVYYSQKAIPNFGCSRAKCIVLGSFGRRY